jgi:outer membrane protein TolC
MSGSAIALNILRKQYREIREALLGDGIFTHTEVLQKALSVSDDSQELLTVQDRLAKAEQLIHELTSEPENTHYYWDGTQYRVQYEVEA